MEYIIIPKTIINHSRYNSSESGYASSTMAMSRTRSHHQLTSSNSNSNNSSGEDSYSRPPSRGGYNTYAGHHSGQRKNSYTREYVRNLPPASASSAANGGE